MIERSEPLVLLVDALWAAGTRLVFGLPGGGDNLDAVGAAMDRGMRFILTHSETSAAIMAATCGELTGSPGFCITTRGPGAANAVNGVVHALLDRDPLVLLTDSIRKADRTRISHQRIDQQALFAPVTKMTARLGLGSVRETVAAVVDASTALPCGPSHVTLDPSAPSAVRMGSEYVDPAGSRSVPPALDRSAAIAAARDLLRSARMPIVLVGIGARFEEAAVRRFVENSSVPVLTTYKARGVVADSSPNSAGTVTGGFIEKALLGEADLMITIGLDPVELIPGRWPQDTPMLSLHSWTADSDYFRPTLEVLGPMTATLDALAGCLSGSWEAGAANRHRKICRETLMVSVDGLAPHDLVGLVHKWAPADTMVTVDAGAHMLVAVDLWSVEEPGRLLISNGAATMGYALPAAIAAALVHPDRSVVCLTGDGGLSMVSAELETIARLRLDVKVVVFNDSALSLIEIKQGTGHGGHEAVRFAPTDFAMIARGYGISADQAADKLAVDRISSSMFSRRGPALLDARIDAGGYRRVLGALRGDGGS